ncbi:MAG: RNA polymerase sigma factor [Ruminococcus sp.]|nr:RNA polymerase sigma factor [Ruminococcus sp.]
MDSRLLKELYQKYHRELYLYLYSLCKNREITEDLLQETFLRACLSLSENHTNMRAWLYMVARNLFLNLTKKEKSKLDIEQLRDVSAEDADVPQQIIEQERTRLLYEALQCLDRMKREVLVMQYFGSLSQKEIAAVLRLSPENVRVLSFRGKREIRKIMEASGYDI